MAHFSIQNLTFSYPETDRNALDGISLEIQPGEYITICGKSGCGKTTLLRHLKTVLTPFGQRSGSVLFNGRPLDQVSEREQSSQIGFVMQNPDAQVVTDKVWHELAFGLESLGTDQRTMRVRVAEMASYFGIQNWFHRNVQDLSGGQKQLLNLASIMAMQPSVLVLDEPTSQLDPIAASDFLNTIRKINLELGTTIILTEHRLEEVFAVADRVMVMEAGKVIVDASPREVGDALKDRKDQMFYSLPSPMRVYYGVTDRLQEAAAEGKATAAKAAEAITQLPCPLTVREGRTWLSDYFDARGSDPVLKALPYEDEVETEMNPKDAAIACKEAWFRYEKDGADVLRGVTLQVPEGVLYAIVGGNGTGKSTTLRMLCGIAKPYRGKVYVQGKKLDDWSQKDLFKGCLAMLPQDPQNLFVKKTVRADLLEMLNGHELAAEQKEARIRGVAQLVDIEHLLDSHPFDLSGGEQQRAALAKVLLTQPKILLLDEPTKGLDNAFKKKLAEIFRALKAQGVTIIMASHDVEFCAKHADLVSMFFDGSVVTTNTPRRFFSQNSFYTTAANRMSRHLFENAIVDEDVIELCAR